MKVAMIGQKGIPTRYGGIERHVEELSLRLGAQGHEVCVYTRAWYAAADQNFAPGVRTVATPTIRTKHLDAIVHTFTSTFHALTHGADIIHYHGVGPALLAWIPRLLKPRVRVVVTAHGIDRQHQKWGWFARLALRIGEMAACYFPHETIAVSRTLQSYLKEHYGTAVKYVPNGTAQPARVGSGELKRFGLQSEKYILVVARLLRVKGVHYLISAYRELKRQNRHGGMKLAIVGDAAFTDDYVTELKALANGDTDIVFTGFLMGRALSQAYANAYVVVLPSESEGMPITVLEAMSHGRCVLASDIPAILEITRRYGVNFRNRSVTDLARKLQFLIEQPESVRLLGEASRTFVLKQYHWNSVATAVGQLYDSLAPQRALAPMLKVRV